MNWTADEILAAMTDEEREQWTSLAMRLLKTSPAFHEGIGYEIIAFAARVGARLAVEETEIMATLRIGTELHFFDRETLKELVSETGAKVRYVRAPYPEEPER